MIFSSSLRKSSPAKSSCRFSISPSLLMFNPAIFSFVVSLATKASSNTRTQFPWRWHTSESLLLEDQCLSLISSLIIFSVLQEFWLSLGEKHFWCIFRGSLCGCFVVFVLVFSVESGGFNILGGKNSIIDLLGLAD